MSNTSPKEDGAFVAGNVKSTSVILLVRNLKRVGETFHKNE